MPYDQKSGAEGTAVQYQPTADGSVPFSMPEKFKGKSAEDIARIFVENEKQWGSRSDYDQLKQKVTQYEPLAEKNRLYEEALLKWEQFREPLEAMGWDANKLKQALHPASQPTTLDQYAQRWTELDTSQQLPYLLNEVIIPAYRADQQEILTKLGEAIKRSMEQQNTYYSQKEKLTFSMLKALFPDKDIDGVYQSAYKKAEEMSKSGFDPFQAHLEATLSERKREEEWKKREEQIRADIKREYEAKERPRVAGTTRQIAGQPAKGKREIREAALKRAGEVLSSL